MAYQTANAKEKTRLRELKAWLAVALEEELSADRRAALLEAQKLINKALLKGIDVPGFVAAVDLVVGGYR
jgi:hypothetical protein